LVGDHEHTVGFLDSVAGIAGQGGKKTGGVPKRTARNLCELADPVYSIRGGITPA